ncbi:hypothetical protein PMIN03_007817 [Paraphaeosphaeria minitans]
MQHQHAALQPQSSRQGGESFQHRHTMVSTAGLSPHSHHSEDSWVEVASRPSSSSLSSAADEIITTGLRVQHDSSLHPRRRRARTVGPFEIGTGYRVASAGGNSSQDEYDESESESDRVMTSSNEGIGPSPLQNELRRSTSVASSEPLSEREGDDEGESDDENATAVNYPRSSRRQFAPRPNAFSHPSEQPSIRSQSGTVCTTRRPSARPLSQRHSYPQHTPYNAVSPNAQADHGEALRASLSTLLTAAAAVRGLPKPGQPRPITSHTPGHPTSLRLVPESVALGEIAEDDSTGAPLSPRTVSSSPSEKSKRKASPTNTSTTRSSSKERRAVKKVRQTGPLVEDINPTLLTWVVGAGAVVLVSALSFSAGYVVGKEAGHAEAMGQLGSVSGDVGRCGKEAASELRGAGMGLRRLRWTGGSGVRV